MLNRLYIVIGVVAILILAAAFVVPNLIPWGSYRGRMESLAAAAVGADVQIRGDIHFSLLPQPHLEVTDVAIGPPQAPVVSVKSADADFSLVDFLRDRYSMTRLVLDHPVLNLTINPDGSVDTGLKPAGADSKTNLSASNAQVVVGTVKVNDRRSGRAYSIEGLDGDLGISAIAGPFGFLGGGTFGDQHYNLHVTTSPFDAAGNTQLSVFLHPDGDAFTINADGTLTTAGVPHFSGTLAYRQAPAAGQNANGVIGDLTLNGKLDATPAKMVLADYTLIPDENRAVSRLTGAATLDLGPDPSFSASIASAALALPPRDATAEQGPQPYELVRMLGELPVLPVPPISGTVSATVTQLDLRSFSLQNVSLLATTDARQWSIKSFTGELPGKSAVTLSGDLASPDGRPSFSGTLSISSDRLDTLATLWRKPAADNPLFGLSGSFQSKVSLLGQTMALTDGQLTLGGEPHLLTALIKFGDNPRIDLSGQFRDLNAQDSAALLALSPDLQQDQSAPATFPEGAVSLSADSATIAGLEAHGLALEGKWANGSIEVSKFSATDLGGAGVDLSAALSGTLADPRIAGDGTITLPQGGAPALNWLFDTLGTPLPVRSLLARSLPVDLKAHLDEPNEQGSQGMSLSGKAGAADVTVVAQLKGGVLKALTAPLSGTLDVEASDPRALTAQFGLGDVSLMPDGRPVKVAATFDGAPTGDLKTTLDVTGGDDSVDFDGTVAPGDLSAVGGQGKLKLALSDTSVLAADAGLGGLYAPPVTATADLKFATGSSVELDNLAGTSGMTGFSGNLAMNQGGRAATVSGALTLNTVDVGSLLAAVGGPSALIASAGKLWPDGPLAIGDAPRSTDGSIAVSTPSVTLNGQGFLTGGSFKFGWDATNLGIHQFEGKLGDGSVAFDVDLCCAGAIAAKQVTGEASVKGAPLAALLPPALAETLSGTVDGSVRFSGNGDSIDSVLAGLTGDGSFSVTGLGVQKFDPGVFAEIAAISDIVNVDPADLNARVAAGLDGGAFQAPSVAGSLTIGGGTVRIPNIGATTPTARLFGGATVKLADLSLGGSFGLTPVGAVDKAGLVSDTTSTVNANLSGTLLAPSRTLDIASMVNAIKVQALQVEVSRLEALKAADDARQRAATAAAKQATEDAAAKELADQQAAKAAADAAKQAADAAAAQEAADAAAAKKAAQQAAAAAAAKQRATPAPLDLGMPPANEPFQ